MKKSDTITQITRYAKKLNKDQLEALLEQLRLAELMNEAVSIDNKTAAYQKKRSLKAPSMKEIVQAVYKVRATSHNRHAA